MSLKWMDGVDHYGGDSTKACQGAFLEIGTIETSHDGVLPRTGEYFIATGGYRRALGGDFRVAGVAEGLYCYGMTTDSAAFVSFRDSNNDIQIAVNRDSTGALRIIRGGDNADGGSVIYTTPAPVLTVGAWFHMEARIDCDDTNGALEVRVNGVTAVNLTGINTRPHTGNGRVSQTAAKKYYGGHPETGYDDIFAWAVDGTSDETVTDFVGDRRVATSYPNGDTSNQDFTVNVNQVYEGNGAIANGSTGLTFGAPANRSIGDLWIATMSVTSSQNAHVFPDWTEIVQGNNAGGGRISTWWFRYNGTIPNMTATKGSGGGVFGRIASFRNVKQTGDPIDTVSSINTGSGTTITYPTITPSQSGCVILLADGIEYDDSGRTAPSGYTLAFEYQDNIGVRGSVALTYKLTAGSGATGDQTETVGGSHQWAAVQIALAPATDFGAYQAISEHAPDEDVTYLSSNAVGEADFNVENLPSNAGIVTAVQICTRMKKTDAGPCSMANAVVSNGVEDASADHEITTAYAYYQDVFPLNPDTGSPFTPAEVNALQLRLKRTA